MFVDTNILIEFLKGNKEILEKVGGFNNICTSEIVLMELYQGARNKQDLLYIKKSLKGLKIVETTSEIMDFKFERFYLY